MVWAQLASLAGLWVLGVFAPGFVLTRRLRWSPGERLCAAVGASLFIVYLGAFAVYLGGWGPWGYWAMTAGFAGAGAWCWRDWVRLWRVRGVRRMLGVLAAMLMWGTLCLGLARQYSGGTWAGDWLLHYDKVVVFTTGARLDVGRARQVLIDRAGMMNLVASYFTGQLGLRFEVFQVAFCWLNVLPVLGCCLLAGLFVRRGGRRVWVVAAVLACLPIVWVNATYTWTKMLSAFYTLLGIYLYLRGIKKGDRGRIVGAFASFAVGILVHYVVLPYAVVAGVHYLVLVWRKRERKWAELGMILGAGVVILGTWFGWVVLRYGVGNLAASNNTLIAARHETAGQTAMKMARNAVWNVIPHFFRYRYGVYQQASWPGYVRDYVFLLYQTNMLFVTGTVTGVVAAWAAYRRLLRAPARERGGDRVGWMWALVGGAAGVALVYVPAARNVIFDLFPKLWMLALVVGGCAWAAWAVGRVVRGRERGVSEEVWFWRGLILFLPVATGLALDVPSDYGAGHIFFHPWALMGATLAAVVVWDLPGWVRGAMGAGMATDFALGVWLQFHLERVVFPVLPGGHVETYGLSLQAWENWREKVERGWVFLGDHLAPVASGIEALLVMGAVVAVAYVVWGRTAKVSGGWEERDGRGCGEVAGGGLGPGSGVVKDGVAPDLLKPVWNELVTGVCRGR